MKDKLVAAGIHLGISLVVAGLLLVLLFVIWFPSPLMSLGAVEGVQLILLVDLAIGPLLTLIVFKKGKATLAFDLSIIVALQLSALAYGLSQIYGQTPAHLVLNYNGLHIVTRYEVENYMHPNDFYVPDELSESPVKYQGKIPIYKLIEPQGLSARMAWQSSFQSNSGLPFYMDTRAYGKFENFDYLLDAGRGAINRGGNETCFEIPITSGHGRVLTCLYLVEGGMHLARVIQPEA